MTIAHKSRRAVALTLRVVSAIVGLIILAPGVFWAIIVLIDGFSIDSKFGAFDSMLYAVLAAAFGICIGGMLLGVGIKGIQFFPEPNNEE